VNEGEMIGQNKFWVSPSYFSLFLICRSKLWKSFSLWTGLHSFICLP
jgi:hypothetical protein